MQPSFSAHSTQVSPFGNGTLNTRIMCETPQQPLSTPLSMRPTGGFNSGVNMGSGSIRPM